MSQQLLPLEQSLHHVQASSYLFADAVGEEAAAVSKGISSHHPGLTGRGCPESLEQLIVVSKMRVF